jgi:hypothetical protein
MQNQSEFKNNAGDSFFEEIGPWFSPLAPMSRLGLFMQFYPLNQDCLSISYSRKVSLLIYHRDRINLFLFHFYNFRQMRSLIFSFSFFSSVISSVSFSKSE